MSLRNEKLMIVNAPPAAGTKFVTAPWDGAELAVIETAGAAHVDVALTTAHRLYHRDCQRHKSALCRNEAFRSPQPV